MRTLLFIILLTYSYSIGSVIQHENSNNSTKTNWSKRHDPFAAKEQTKKEEKANNIIEWLLIAFAYFIPLCYVYKALPIYMRIIGNLSNNKF